jgi:twitching motility protein PilT
VNTKAVSNLIREGRTQEVQTVIETGAEQGMVTMNKTLGDLVRRGEITTEDARAYSPDVRELERRI